MAIIIIESPNKREKVKTYSGFETYATIGHFKSLTQNFIKNYEDYECEYDFKDEETKKRMNYIFSQCKNEEVIIATDPDREGYAIGFMFFQTIKNIAKSVKRAEFFEITEAGIKKGLEKAIDFSKTNFKDFEAFKARSVGDKLVGFIMSPQYIRLLNDKNTSVGRVQTPALNLIVSKEEEITKFNSLNQEEKVDYKLKAKLKSNEGLEFEVKSEKTYPTKKEIEDFLAFINESKKATLQEITQKQSLKAPPKPFRTSQLQEKANQSFGFSPDTTMSLAQSLFENGLITYTRTDSNALSKEFIAEVESVFSKEKWYQKREYKAGKQSQAEAHEAIRITHLHSFKECQEVFEKAYQNSKDPKLSKDKDNLLKLYKLIYQNSIASQAKDSVSLIHTYQFNIKAVAFNINTSKLIDKGYKGIFEEDFEEEAENQNNEDNSKIDSCSLDLSSLKKEENFEVLNYEIVEIKKQAPSRYKESNFIALLEKEGIGRPSTYASFLPLLLKRNYIELEKKGKNNFIKPTQKGIKIIELLRKENEWVTQSEYTKLMEEVLESISKNQTTYLDFIKSLHEKMGFAKINEEEDRKPSAKQIQLLEKLSKEQNKEIPKEAYENLSFYNNLIKVLLANAPKKPPSEKQIALAEKQAKENNLELPKGYKEDYKVCTDFIDKCFKKNKK